VDYPSLTIMQESRWRRLGGINSQRSTNGMLRSRRLYSNTITEYTLVHWLSPAEKSTLDSHYGSSADGTFSFTWPGQAPVFVRYLEAPQYEERNGWWIATVQLAQVS
jgi:hypothetical protein